MSTVATGADRCLSCGRRVLWAVMPSRQIRALEPEEVPPNPGGRVVAYDSRGGRAVPVTYSNLSKVSEWQSCGWTFHERHHDD